MNPSLPRQRPDQERNYTMSLLSDRTRAIGTENAFKIGPHIARVERALGPVVKLNIGEPDFNAPPWVMAEVIAQIRADNTH